MPFVIREEKWMCGPVHLLKTKNKLGNGVALLCTASRISCSTKTPRPKQHLTRSYLTFKTGQLQLQLFGSSFLSQAAGQLLLSPCCGLMWFVCVRKMTERCGCAQICVTEKRVFLLVLFIEEHKQKSHISSIEPPISFNTPLVTGPESV